MLRELLLKSHSKTAIKRLSRAFERGQLSNAVELVRTEAGGPGRAKHSIITVDKAVAVDPFDVGECRGQLQCGREGVFHGERPLVVARVGEILVSDEDIRVI